MTDSQDPYNTPPAPDRFAPPSEHVDPFVPARGDESAAEHVGTPADIRHTAAETHEVAPSEHIARGPMALEPLPATVGNFGGGSVETGGAVDTQSLSGKLADEFVAWLKTLASAAVYATLIVTFGFQVARVEGQSMAPTLEDQDRLIVNKLAYRLGDPHIGDIVMLYYPNDPNKSFVKRVVAEPQDVVKIVNGKVYRNDVLADDSFVPAEYRSHEDWGPQVIPEGYYFVMGDHRNNSSDSRHWGFVPKKYIIGRVQLRWWPVPEARTF